MEKKDKKLLKLPWPYSAIRWLFPKLAAVSYTLAEKLAVKLFFRPFRVPPPKREWSVIENANKIKIVYNKNEVSCYTWGKGIPVILTHGWSGRSGQFFKFVEILTKNGFKAISFDAPAHGASKGTYTSMVEFAEIIQILAEKYNAEILIGHSLGGVASIYANTEGLKVNKIVTINSPAIGDEILKDYLDNISLSYKATDALKNYMTNLRNKPYEEYMPLHTLGKLKDVALKMIYDKTDTQVSYKHAEAVMEAYPDVDIVSTSGYGHNRILSNVEVIHTILAFIGDEKEKQALETMVERSNLT